MFKKLKDSPDKEQKIRHQNGNIASDYVGIMRKNQDEWKNRINTYILQNRDLIQKYCAVKFYTSQFDSNTGGIPHYKSLSASEMSNSKEYVKDGLIDTNQSLLNALRNECICIQDVINDNVHLFYESFQDYYDSCCREILNVLTQKCLSDNSAMFTDKELNSQILDYMVYLLTEDFLYDSYCELLYFTLAPEVGWSEKELAIPFGEFIKFGEENQKFIYDFCRNNDFDEEFCKQYEFLMDMDKHSTENHETLFLN